MDLIGSVGRLADSFAKRKARQDRAQSGHKKTDDSATPKPVDPASARPSAGNESPLGKNVDISV